MQGDRAQRVAEEIQKVVASLFTDELKDDKLGLITIPRVKCSRDLKRADVYFSVYGTKLKPSRILSILNKKKKYIRSVVAREVQLKYVPELRFFIDDTLDYVEKIENLIQKIHNE